MRVKLSNNEIKKMTKIWKFESSKKNNIIVIDNQKIYKGIIDKNEFNYLNKEKIDTNILKKLFPIPYSYIKLIENQKGNEFIKIYFGVNSEEELFFDNEKVKDEVFEYLKSDFNLAYYSKEIPTIYRYAKPQIFALIIVTLLYFWSVYLAVEIENGAVYQIIGNSGGFLSFILILANLGSLQLSIAYLILLGVMFFSLNKKLKSRTEIEYLRR